MEFQLSLSPTAAAERLQAMTFEVFNAPYFHGDLMRVNHIYSSSQKTENGVDFVFYSRDKGFLHYFIQDLYLRGTITQDGEGSRLRAKFRYPQVYKILLGFFFFLWFAVTWVIQPKAEPISIATFLILFILIPAAVHRRWRAYQIQKLESVFDGYIK